MKRETTTGPTPGPWTFGWIGNVGEPGLGRPCVGTSGAADWVGPEGAEADARLIASAPDLLAALNHAVEILRCGAFVRLEDPRVAEAVSSALWTARSALARAEGKSI